MAEFARKARLAVKYLAVDDHPQPQSPAGVNVEHRLLGVGVAVHIFAVSGGTGVVLDVDRRAETLFEQHRQRLFLDEEIAVTVSGLRIDAARNIHPDGQHLVAGDLARTDEILNHVAKTVQRTGIVVHQKIDRRFIDQLSLEIDGGHHDRILAQIDADEIPGIGIQAVDIRPSSAGRPLLAEIVHEALVDQLPDEFGHGRHAQIHGLAQIGDARIAAENVLTDNLLFENSGLVAFRGQFEERIGHFVGVFDLRLYDWVKIKINSESGKHSAENAPRAANL